MDSENDMSPLRDEITRLQGVIARAGSVLADRWAHADAPYEPVALEALAILGEVADFSRGRGTEAERELSGDPEDGHSAQGGSAAALRSEGVHRRRWNEWSNTYQDRRWERLMSQETVVHADACADAVVVSDRMLPPTTRDGSEMGREL